MSIPLRGGVDGKGSEASNTLTSDTCSFDVGCSSFCGVDGFGFFSGGCSTGAGVGDSLRLALMVVGTSSGLFMPLIFFSSSFTRWVN